MLSINELKFLRHIFEHLLKDVEDYVNRVHIYLLNLNNLFQEIKYKLRRSYYYISLTIYFLTFYIAINSPSLKVFNIKLSLLIPCIIFIFPVFYDQKLVKFPNRIAIFTDFKRFKRKIRFFKNNLEIILGFTITKEFDENNELKEYLLVIEEKIITYNQSLSSFLKNYLTSNLVPIVILIFSSFAFSILLNPDYLWSSLAIHIIPLISFISNRTLPTFIDFKFLNEVNMRNIIKILTTAEENNDYPTKLIIELLNNISYFNFSNFERQVLCDNCMKITSIDSIDAEKNQLCIHCHHSIEILNKIVFIESFKLEYYCVRCGFSNTTLVKHPFNKKLTCGNCKYEIEGIIYPQIVEMFNRILGRKVNVGIIFICQTAPKDNKLYYFFIYFDFKLMEPVLKLIPIDINKLIILTISFDILKKLLLKFQNYYPLISKSFIHKKYYRSHLRQIKDKKRNLKEIPMFNNNNLIEKDNNHSKNFIRIIQKIEKIDTKYRDSNTTIKRVLIDNLNLLNSLDFKLFSNFCELIEFFIRLLHENNEISNELKESADIFWRTNKDSYRLNMEKKWFQKELYKRFIYTFGEEVVKEPERTGGKVDFEVFNIPIDVKVFHDKNYPNDNEKSGMELLKSSDSQVFQYIAHTRCGFLIGYDYRQNNINNKFKRLATSECILLESEGNKIIYEILIIGNQEKPSKISKD